MLAQRQPTNNPGWIILATAPVHYSACIRTIPFGIMITVPNSTNHHEPYDICVTSESCECLCYSIVAQLIGKY